MVVGIDTFRRYFAAHSGQYVIIGGTACDLVFTEAALAFRGTKDIDLVLCVEVVDAAFAGAFKQFLEDGGYQVWSASEGDRKFFRFEKPTEPGFPFMIELFARPPAAFDLPESDRYVRLPVEDAIVSLSALLLDEAYYAALKDGSRMVDGVPVLGETLLIPFKARAYLDLTERKANGDDKVKGDDIKKHRNDVFRLLQLVPGEGSVELSTPIKDDLRRFVAAMADVAVNARLRRGHEQGRKPHDP